MNPAEIQSHRVLMAYLIGACAGVAALCLVGAVFGLGLPHVMTLPAWVLGWYWLCWGVDRITKLVREYRNG